VVFQESRKQKFEIYGGLPSFLDYSVVEVNARLQWSEIDNKQG